MLCAAAGHGRAKDLPGEGRLAVLRENLREVLRARRWGLVRHHGCAVLMSHSDFLLAGSLLRVQAKIMLEGWDIDNEWKLPGNDGSKEQALQRCVAWQHFRDCRVDRYSLAGNLLTCNLQGC